MTPASLLPRFAVRTGLYAGKVGLLVRRATQYGREMIALKIEGAMFPVLFEPANVQPYNGFSEAC